MTSGKHKRFSNALFRSKFILFLASTALLISQLIFVQTPASAVTVGSGSCVTQVSDSTGVTVTTSGSECIIKFTSSGSNSWTAPANLTSIRLLLVGGGGGGDRGVCGSIYGHGAGGGEVKDISVGVNGSTAYNLTIGDGGAPTSSGCGTPAFDGGASSFASTYIADGGKAATFNQRVGGSSGSNLHSGGTPVSTLNDDAGGGGGAGGNGNGLNGGPGVTSNITGVDLMYGSGGPGFNSSGYGTYFYTDGSQTNGSTAIPANTGIGGSELGPTSGRGGSAGIVVIRWQPISSVLGTSTSDECAQYGSGVTGSVLREGNYCLVAIKGPAVTSGSSGSWIVPNGVNSIDYLVVGGGGGGGNFGGGGAGSFNESTNISVASRTSMSVTIGAGGAGSNYTAAGANGSSSAFNSLTSAGGGGGGSVNGSTVQAPRSTSGSGGGYIATQSGAAMGALTAGATAGTSIDTFQNNGGGSKTIYATVDALVNRYWPAGGAGGGAGAGGGNATWTSDGTAANTYLMGGVGGNGKSTSLLSSTAASTLAIGKSESGLVYFAGGGGGGVNNNGIPLGTSNTGTGYGAGGKGGGGGGFGSGNPASFGTANSGSGGGGGRSTGLTGSGVGGSGGSGVVLIRYTIPQVLSVSAINASTTEVDLTWTRPASGVESITGYNIEKSLKGANTWTTATTTAISSPNSANGTTVTGLSVNTEYDFRVTPIFASGSGVVSLNATAATLRNVQTVSWNPANTSVQTSSSPLTPSSLATTNGDGSITYSVQSAGSTGCTVNSTTSVLTFSAAGSCVLRASAAQTSNYASAYKDVTFTITTPAATSTPTPTAEPTTNSSPSSTPIPTPSATKKATTTKKKTDKPSTNNSTQNPINTVQPTPTPSKSATSIPMNSQSATPTPVAPKSEFKQLENAPYPGSGLTKPIAGEIVAALNGERVEASVTTTAIDTKVQITADQSVVLFTQSQLGESLPLTEEGVIEVKDEAKVFAEVTGFGKNTPVEVWVFSTPIRLGGGYTNDTGDFTGQFKLDAQLPSGNHTLQLNGLDNDGNVVTVAIGMVKKESKAPQATASVSTITWFEQTSAVVFGAIIFGLILLLIRRRRREEAN